MVPNMLWFEKRRPKWHEELFFEGHIFWILFAQVWESSGKNPSHSQKFASSYTYATENDVMRVFYCDLWKQKISSRSFRLVNIATSSDITQQSVSGGMF